jgi:hypothetical protein
LKYLAIKIKIMKNTILAIIVLLSWCGYTQTVPLGYGDFESFNGAYNKDVDDDFNKFIGTWIYFENGKKLTLQLKKIWQYHYQDEKFNYYRDIVVGEYKYEENNNIIVNTLPNMLSVTDNNAWQHNIFGSALNGNAQPINNGAANERTIVLRLQDPDRPYIPAQIRLKYKIENGIEKIVVKIMPNGAFVEPFDNAPSRLRIPNADYTLIKQ